MNTKLIVIYWIILAAVIYLEHRKLAYRWRHYELARRTLGIATVMLGAFPLVCVGVLDPFTWLVIFVGFGIAGAIVGSLYTHKAAVLRDVRMLILTNALLEKAEGTNGKNPGQDIQRRTRVPRK